MPIETLEQITQDMLLELQSKHPPTSSSLSYTPHHIVKAKPMVDGQLFQVIVVGGTYYKCALFEYRNGQAHIKDAEDGKLQTLATDGAFLTFIESLLHPSIDRLVVNFAFPLKPITDDSTHILDGILLAESKEHKLVGLIGKAIGKQIKEHVFASRGQEIQVSVANDTICLLLSGLTDTTTPQSIAAGIVGTGVNFAYFETDECAVNTEAGNFSAFAQPHEMKLVDRMSSNPGAALYEKTVAGAYLYKLYNERIKELDNMHESDLIKDTQELDDLARSADQLKAPIAQEILTRSAQLTACMMAALMLHKKRSLTFVMEGSVFWKAWNYEDMVNATVHKLAPDYTMHAIRVSESNVLGAAQLLP